MSGIQIQTDIPVPKRGAPVGPRGSKYPFAQMTVGASFFAPGVKAATLQSCARRYARSVGATGMAFTSRNTTENGKTGARCWRTA